MDAGLKPFDAIRAATSLAAARLALEADLIVVDRNPLDDMIHRQDVLVVISNGQVAVNRIPKVRDDDR